MSTAKPLPPVHKLAYRPGDIPHVARIARSTVYELLNNGEIPSFKIGKTTLILHDDLIIFLRRRAGKGGRES